MSDFHTGNCCWSHRPLDLEGTGEVYHALLEVAQQDNHVERPSRHLKNIDGSWKGRSELDLWISGQWTKNVCDRVIPCPDLEEHRRFYRIL